MSRERRSGLASTSSPPMTMSAPSSTSLSQPTDRSRQRRRLKVVIEGRHTARISGHGSRELLTELRNRAPVWSSISRSWVTTEAVARSLVALAEHRGFEVDVESYVVIRPTTAEPVIEQPDPGRGLW